MTFEYVWIKGILSRQMYHHDNEWIWKKLASDTSPLIDMLVNEAAYPLVSEFLDEYY